MAFQRSHSKVWWGSSNSETLYSYYNNNNEYHSLDSNYRVTKNLSRIQELDESTKSRSSIQDSPGSLRSQDSGFSDNDDASQGHGAHKSGNESEASSMSPSSMKTIQTPPTVIRRKPLESPIISSKRISLSAPSSPTTAVDEIDLLNQISRIGFVDASTPKKYDKDENDNESTYCKCSNPKDKSIRRRRVIINRKTRRSLIDSCNASAEVSLLSASSEDNNTKVDFKDYNNETVYLGGEEDRNNNSLNKTINNSTLPGLYISKEYSSVYGASTSTPKSIEKNASSLTRHIQELSLQEFATPLHTIYDNPLLNGHPEPLQRWLEDIRMSYNHEVMSTLQTKSIAQEAFRNLKITTTTVAKIIRQLQTRALILQGEFERVEKMVSSEVAATFGDCLVAAGSLVESNIDYSKALERRIVFFNDCQADRKKFEDNIDHIKMILKDLKISLEKQHYLDIASLSEDIQVLKRYVLITLRLVFEKLIRVIISNIESAKCDLVLRANLNMISTLSNMDYTGFASLNEAFLKNEAIRVFLLICLDSKYSTVRALALRALATICSTQESIKQFGEAGGVEIVKDILLYDSKRTEPERREAVSLLTQITAPWHGSGHKVAGLKDSVESIVASITDIISRTTCCQTLLLCAASLNNLSRLEVTSIYSIMSNESVVKLKDAVESRGPGVSIFLYEQIVSMLHNMSTNKKCHSHLANRSIINFITSIFQSQFYEKFTSRAENDSHHRTIKGILHIFSRLIHESVVGQEILENNFVPIFSRVESSLNSDNEYSKDISFISKKLNDSLSHKSGHRLTNNSSSSTSNLRLNSSKQESFV